MMTVAQLMPRLEDCDPEAEVRLAHQPQWAIEYTIVNVEESGNLLGAYDCEQDDENDEDLEDPHVVWIYEGTQLGYLPGWAKRGW